MSHINEEVLNALYFYGNLNKEEIIQKLRLRNIPTNPYQIEGVIQELIDQKRISKATGYNVDTYTRR